MTSTVSTWDSVLAELNERKNHFHAQGYIPRDFIEKFFDLGLYRAATPMQFGGSPIPTHEFLQMIERIGRIDGSTAWTIGFASGTTYLAALPVHTQQEIYRDGPDIVFTGAMYPMQPAERTGDGYLVTGRWKFASGCMGADYIAVGLLDPEGAGKPRAAVIPTDKLNIVQQWDVSGMRASGSFDIVVENCEVPLDWTFIRGGGSNIDEPLFRYPLIGYQAQVHAAVGLGVAQGALDYAEQAGSYRGITGAPPVGERAYYRSEFARSYVALQSARSYFLKVAEEVWDTAVAGDPISDRQKAHIRLSAINVSDTASQVVHDIAKISGAQIIQNSHPLNALMQDAYVPQLHATLSQHMYDDAGAVLLGLAPTTPGFV